MYGTVHGISQCNRSPLYYGIGKCLCRNLPLLLNPITYSVCECTLCMTKGLSYKWGRGHAKFKNGAINSSVHTPCIQNAYMVNWYSAATLFLLLGMGSVLSLNLAHPASRFEFCHAISCTHNSCPLPHLYSLGVA